MSIPALSHFYVPRDFEWLAVERTRESSLHEVSSRSSSGGFFCRRGLIDPGRNENSIDARSRERAYGSGEMF